MFSVAIDWVPNRKHLKSKHSFDTILDTFRNRLYGFGRIEFSWTHCHSWKRFYLIFLTMKKALSKPLTLTRNSQLNKNSNVIRSGTFMLISREFFIKKTPQVLTYLIQRKNAKLLFTSYIIFIYINWYSCMKCSSVSYTHLTLPTICSV